MTLEFQWELSGQNVSYGDGLYATNATAGARRVSPLFGSFSDVPSRPCDLSSLLLGCPS